MSRRQVGWSELLQRYPCTWERDWPAPHNVHELRIFLGFTNYFRKFLQGYSQRTGPLTKLMRKNVAYEWDKTCQDSFEQLKRDLTSAPVVCPDPTQPYELIADACRTGIGAVLMQHEFRHACLEATAHACLVQWAACGHPCEI